MKVEFKVKYGKNTIYIPDTSEAKPKFRPYNITNKYKDKVTIYNDVVNSEGLRVFNSCVIDKCMIYNQLVESADGTIQRVVDTQNIITKDTEHYKPISEYAKLTQEERKNYYTVQVDDFIIFDVVDDVVTTGMEFKELQEEHKGNGLLVTGVYANVRGMMVDNVQIVGGGING